ncbi:hypothetical protein ACIBHX_24475 [Nonomuraea sp. NPDC050536]|uniref:hypothetical protein n=1 Tax=Nonomuraea sp. NPDC050536 TaxID=3364366 RepID=UPI0037C7222F
MRAVLFDRVEPGSDELGIVVRHIERPEPGPGEIRLRVSAYGLNQADLLLMAGRHYATSDLPMAGRDTGRQGAGRHGGGLQPYLCQA